MTLHYLLSDYTTNFYLIGYLLIMITFTLFVFMFNLYLQSSRVNEDEDKYTIDLVARALVRTGRCITIIFVIKIIIFALLFFFTAVNSCIRA